MIGIGVVIYMIMAIVVHDKKKTKKNGDAGDHNDSYDNEDDGCDNQYEVRTNNIENINDHKGSKNYKKIVMMMMS